MSIFLNQESMIFFNVFVIDAMENTLFIFSLFLIGFPNLHELMMDDHKALLRNLC